MIKFYTKSTDAWDGMFEGIKSATRSIYIEMYIFSDDTAPTHDFVGLLEQKSRDGVQVILILDAFGSTELSDASIDRLRESGSEIIFFHHWFNRTHRKLVIIDGNIAFLGGTNISGHSSLWNDLQIRVSRQLAHRFVRIFHRSYILSGGRHKLIENISSRKYKFRAWIIDHLPFSGRKKLRRYYEKKISKARNSIVFVTPYFVPSFWFINLIKEAIARKVAVTILIPRSTDHYFLDKVNQYWASFFMTLGCYVYVSESMNHAKALLIDNKEGMVGSGNLDSLSFERNSELGIFFTNKVSIQKLNTIFNMWIKDSTPYNKEVHSLRFYEWLLIPIIRFLRPVL